MHLCRKLFLLKDEEDKMAVRESLKALEKAGILDVAVIPEYASTAEKLKDFIG